MANSITLYEMLLTLDGRNYKAYKALQGTYDCEGFRLLIDHVQGDPFAAPSRVRVQVPHAIASRPTSDPISDPISDPACDHPLSTQASIPFPADLVRSPSRVIALCDYLTRQFDQAAAQIRGRRGSGKSGLIAIASLGQQILERTSVVIRDTTLEARFVVGLPARGRTILGQQAAELLCDDIPALVEAALTYHALDAQPLQHHVETVEDADWLRQQLAGQHLVAFIADGATLPRQSGVDDRPLARDSVPFQSPDSLRVTFDCPNLGRITGMGIPAGITLIVGGGYHGKSTLLRAIALGIYNHIPGDGRERVVTDGATVKVRAEDGRSVAGVDISPFINHLPQGRPTTQFSTANASGSTSQAATIIEALEMNAQVLLVDEDTSATNFMIRDRRMQALIAKEKEPITPFIDKIEQLYHEQGVSTILVMGGSGDYFDVANRVIGMTDFQPYDLTQDAKAIAQQYGTERTPEGGTAFGTMQDRVPKARRLDASDDPRGPKIKVRRVNEICFGAETIDVSAIDQLVDQAQLQAIARAIAHLQDHALGSQQSLSRIIYDLIDTLTTQGLDMLSDSPRGDLAMVRSFEVAAALNRLRSLEILDQSPPEQR